MEVCMHNCSPGCKSMSNIPDSQNYPLQCLEILVEQFCFSHILDKIGNTPVNVNIKSHESIANRLQKKHGLGRSIDGFG